MAINKESSLYKALFEAAADGIIIINGRGIIQSFSPSAELLFGYSEADVFGQNVSILMPKSDGERHDGYLKNHLDTGKTAIIGQGREVIAMKKNGQLFQMHLSVGRAETPEGEPFFVGICHDLSMYKNVVEQLERVDIRYRNVFDSEGLFIVRITLDGAIILSNKSFSQQFHFNKVSGDDFLDCVAGSSKRDAQWLFSLSKNGFKNELKMSLMMKGASSNTEVEWRFKIVKDNIGCHIQGVGIDVSEKVVAANEAFFLRNFDSVTKLPQIDYVQQLFNANQAENTLFCFMAFELTDFDRIRKLNGEVLADKMLEELARSLEERVSYLHCCRLQASRFLIIFDVDSTQGVEQQVEHKAASLHSELKRTVGEISSETRIGSAYFSKNKDTFHDVVERSLMAIEYSRQNMQFLSCYNESIHQAADRKKGIQKALIKAIKDVAIDVYFQPKIDLEHNRVAGYEALMRWFSLEYDYISPWEMIETAQELNFLLELDKCVVNKTLSIIKANPDTFNADTPVAINISAKSFSMKPIIGVLIEGIEAHGIDPRSIEVEVTEDALLTIGDQVKSNANRLRAAGVKICLDDFGTGYSSLSYLGKLPLDNLKIDRSFVIESEQKSGRLMLEAIVSIAKSFHLTVTAEGVETPDQQAFLASIGCEYAQGFYYSKGIPVQDIPQWLASYQPA
ncbi:EAL domain-containing protein [Marinomonas sp. M1K-6]|uniref:Sensor protein FixL n=1 Tax=Marinomonas profundi TaxID=2726122 RepID=A0A847R7U5_9GAMM|nr:EAL domain-containing protein [Marinomonas profundi]NLQ18563.1 EAL domain-containing protein [Marinomonas profundi]UDV04435.1 EAL domain-containing protein [Marinomonas profundi]